MNCLRPSQPSSSVGGQAVVSTVVHTVVNELSRHHLRLACESWPLRSSGVQGSPSLRTGQQASPGQLAVPAGRHERTRIAWSCLELPDGRPDFIASQSVSPTLYLHHFIPLLIAISSPTAVPYQPPFLFSSSRDQVQKKHRPGNDVTMDTLVARYSRPSCAQNEGLTEQDELDFSDAVPGPSLKFAMPPVAQVSPPMPRPPTSPLRTSKQCKRTSAD